MSALPPLHQFRDAQPFKGQPLPDDLREASDLFEIIPKWDEVLADEEADQEAWHYRRHGRHRTDSTGTKVYPYAFRLGLIVTLALASWAVVLTAGHFLVKALH